MSDQPDTDLPAIDLQQLIPDLPQQYNYRAALELACQGATFPQIAAAMGCDRQTLITLRQRYVPFNNALQLARAHANEYLADELRTLCQDNPQLHDKPQVLKTMFDAGKWFLAVADPRKYGDRMHLEVTERVDLKSALQQAEQRVIVINASKPVAEAAPQADADKTV